ncbi:MAG TPA: MBL fold metallo-hydrolase [bacterium]|nr:MBL fold metallo-hydrolase [bacterium]
MTFPGMIPASVEGMVRKSYLAALLSLSLPACLAMPPPEELFQSRANIAPRAASEEDGKLEIWIPYVGQGDGTLVVLPNGKNLLIDAGPPGAGKNYLLPLLAELKIQTINALVVSHYDLDHIGGVSEIPLGLDGLPNTADDVNVLAVYDRGGEPWDSSPGYGKYLESLDDWKIPRRTLSAGDSLLLDSAVSIRCVVSNGIVGDGSSAPEVVDISPATYAGRENAASVGLLIEFGDFRYLTAGDLTGGGMADGFLTPDVETPLAELVGEVDAVHVNHHGSGSSSNEEFVKIGAQMVFIQAGKDNPYHHPTNEVLQKWADLGSEIYSTADGDGFALESKDRSISVQLLELQLSPRLD